MLLNGGLNKVGEECSELTTICCKWECAISAELGHIHYDGTDLKERFVEEAGDVLAAITYGCNSHEIDIDLVLARAQKKLELFKSWEDEQRAK